MKVNSFVPRQAGKVHFAISADDCLLHFEANELNAKQLARIFHQYALFRM